VASRHALEAMVKEGEPIADLAVGARHQLFNF
jgi:hypothetical protein